MCEQFSIWKFRKNGKGKLGNKPSQKLMLFKKLHDIENWKMELKLHLTLKYNKIVHFIKCVLERVNKNYKS